MSHRTFFEDRLTAIVGVVLLATLVGASYFYSIQQYLSGLKYVPSAESPDFRASDVVLTDFNSDGSPKQQVSAFFEHFTNNSLMAHQVNLRTLNPSLPTLTAHADRAWSKDALQTIEFKGSVTLERHPFAKELPFFFSTDSLKGYLDTYTFDTSDKVAFRWGIDTTESQHGLHYDHIARSIDLFGGVHTVIRSTSDDSSSHSP